MDRRNSIERIKEKNEAIRADFSAEIGRANIEKTMRLLTKAAEIIDRYEDREVAGKRKKRK